MKAKILVYKIVIIIEEIEKLKTSKSHSKSVFTVSQKIEDNVPTLAANASFDRRGYEGVREKLSVRILDCSS
jgi:hypothetical protein